MKKAILITLIAFTVNGLHAQWQEMNGPAAPAISLLTNGTDVFAGCGNISAATGVRLSSDNGLNWNPVNNDGIIFDIPTLAKNQEAVFAAQDNNVYSTSNNGANWTNVSSGLPDYTIHALVEGNGKIFASSLGVSATTDNGQTWTNSSVGWSSNTLSLAVQGDTVAAGTQNNGVFISTDNGESWTQSGSSLPPTKILSVAIFDTTFLAGTNSGVYRSSDIGATWILSGLTVRTNSLVIVGSTIFAGSTTEGVYASTDTGLTWTEINEGLSPTEVNALAANDDYLFAGVVGSRVWRRPLSEILTTGTNQLEDNNRVAVYPNPATDKLHITLPNPTGKTAIRIYTTEGQEVAATTYGNSDVISIDVGHLAKGFYFIEIKTESGSFLKKVVVE